MRMKGLRPKLGQRVKRGLRLVSIGALALSAGMFAFVVLAPLLGVEIRMVVSGSMAPHMPRGSVVVAVPVSIASVREGDVILFRQPDDLSRVITHRVSDIESDGSVALVTKGDANNTPDPWRVGESNLMGRVELHLPLVGYAVQALRSEAGIVLALLVPCAFILATEASFLYRFVRYGDTSEGPA